MKRTRSVSSRCSLRRRIEEITHPVRTSALRHLIFGSPFSTTQTGAQLLPKILALPVFSSDALSSVAYGTQEILLQLTLAGAVGMTLTVPISLAIVVVLVLVTLSYQQTVYAYPSGGGSYIVAKENLSVAAGLLAAAALLIDYVLTVAVSIAAGAQQITSFVPALAPHPEALCLVAGGGMPLVIVESPYRSLVEPLFAYIQQVQQERPGQLVTVVPQFVGSHWWEYLLHHNTAHMLNLILTRLKGVVVTEVRYSVQ
jgi:amino acid transporter